MELEKKQSLSSLWLYSFIILGRTWWRLIVLFFVFIVIGQILSMILRGGILFFGGVPMLSGNFGGAWKLILGLGILAAMVWQWFTCYGMAILIQLFDKAARGDSPSIFESLSSFRASFSLFVVTFLSSLLLIPGGILARGESRALGVILNIVILLTVSIRWIYAPGYAVLQEQGGLDSMRSSWNLTSGRYVDTLLVGIILVLSWVGYLLIAFSTVYAFAWGNFPTAQALADIVNKPFWVIIAFACSQLLAFVVAVFINRDLVENPKPTPQDTENWVPPQEDMVSPQPVIFRPSAHPNQDQKPPTMDKI